MSDSPDNRYSAVVAESYDARVRSIAAGLRRLAEAVEHNGRPGRNYATGVESDYLRGAERVVHAVTWGVANLHLDTLINEASEVHRAREIEAQQAREGSK